MKHNRSLKEIFVPKTHFKDKEETDSMWSPRNFQPENYPFTATKPELKLTKNTQSQKNLFNINPISTNLASPKYPIQPSLAPANILTPANNNKNVPVSNQ